jgi:hypothetical protein
MGAAMAHGKHTASAFAEATASRRRCRRPALHNIAGGTRGA